MHVNLRDDYKILHMDPSEPNIFVELQVPSDNLATTSDRDRNTRASNFDVIAPMTALLACQGRTFTIGVTVVSL